MTTQQPTVVTRWWWIRHAPVPNPEQRCYGQRDMACDTSNVEAFRALASRLPDNAVWVTTNLQRTQKTAAAIHAAWQPVRPSPAVAIEPDLVEQHFGEWQGRTYAEIGAFGTSNGASGHRFWLAPAHEVPPGGENFVSVMQRVSGAVARLTRAHAGRDVVVVAHGGSIRAALALALGLEPEAALAVSIEPLSLTRIDHIEGPGAGHGWRISAVNHVTP
ncbi:MAG TPA: histidine phosphatase family protein [Alphaproteobacteria bacterium]|nr:histidine phosphatase family protein [Alphaproteobacteria bacterium]